MRRAATMCMVWVVWVAGVGVGQEPPKRFVQSSCLLKAATGAEETKVIGALANTADVGGKAAREVLGLDQGPRVTWDQVMHDVLQLSADLPTEVSGKASAYWAAIGTNLRTAMEQIYEEDVQQLRLQLAQAEERKAELLAKLRVGPSTSPGDRAIQEQLAAMVDLSKLKRGMPLRDAIEVLKGAVNPPLKLTVLWKDLADTLGVLEGTPIDLEGVNPMKLETGLRLVLKLASDAVGQDGEQAMAYTIDGGVIIIATGESLGSLHRDLPEGSGEASVSVDDLTTRKQGLVNRRQDLEMDSLRLGARRQAMEQQAAELRMRIDKALDQDALIHELQRLVDTMAQGQARVQAMIEKGVAPQTQFDEAVERLVKAKIDLARQREAAAQSAGGEQLAKLTGELSDLAIQLAERDATMPALQGQISRIEAQISHAATSVPQTIERDLAITSLRQAEERIQLLRLELESLRSPAIMILGAGK